MFYTYLDLQSKINSVSPAAQKPLVGADAIKSLSRIASSIR
nr:MAG TPA: hypothetical protein [Caudoviricetes sp.]